MAQLTAEVTYALAERTMPDLSASWQTSTAGRPSSPVCFGDRTQPNAVGGRDLWHEHGAESKNACPAHVEPNPRRGALYLLVTHARCPYPAVDAASPAAARVPRVAMSPRCQRGYEFSPPDVDCHVTLPWGSCPCNGVTIPRLNWGVRGYSRLEGVPFSAGLLILGRLGHGG